MRRSLFIVVALLSTLAACVRGGFSPTGAPPETSDGLADRGPKADGASIDARPADGQPVQPVDQALPAERRSDLPSAHPEDCLNGLDDDGNGLLDCEDPSCTAGYECVDLPPAGTASHVRLASSTFTTSPPPLDCGGSQAARYYTEPGAAACAPCACASPKGSCSPPTVTAWGTGSCTGSTGYDKTAILAQPGCVAGAGGMLSLGVSGPPVPTAMCAASGGGVTTPPFAKILDVCPSSLGSGCGSGRGCARRAEQPFEAKLCYQSSATTCPLGYTITTGHASYVDQRTCSACGCALPKNTCLGGSYTVFGCTTSCSTAGCAKNTLGYSTPTICLELAPYSGSWSVSYTPPTLTTTPCSPSGGQPSGAVIVPAQPATFCCK